MIIHRLLLLLTLLLLSFPATLRAADRLATDAELQQMFDQKQYRACLQQSARILMLRSDISKPYDLYTLHMRRGECLLNLDDPTTALIAFSAALPLADTPAKADQARALVALLTASRGHNYTPNSGAAPLNIIPLPSRQAAMQACFTDKFTAAAPNLKAAFDATSLIPIIKFIPIAQDLHALETAALGSDPQTRPMLLALGDKARSMITDTLQSLDYKITAIQTQAGQLVASGDTIVTRADGTEWYAADTRVGLSSDDRNYLRQQIPYLNDILTVSKRGKQTAQSFGATGDKWDPIIQSANQTLQHAQSVLDAD